MKEAASFLEFQARANYFDLLKGGAAAAGGVAGEE